MIETKTCTKLNLHNAAIARNKISKYNYDIIRNSQTCCWPVIYNPEDDTTLNLQTEINEVSDLKICYPESTTASL